MIPVIKVILHKDSMGKLTCSDKNLFKIIREHFSVSTPNYAKRQYDNRTYVITLSGVFEVGIFEEIVQYVKKLQVRVRWDISSEFKLAYRPSLDIKEISKIENFNYYDYQEEMINHFIKNGRGICLAATSAGKTLVMGGLAKTLLDNDSNKKILIIVPGVSLLRQTYSEFVDNFNIPSVEIWGDGETPSFTKSILVASMKSLYTDIEFTLENVSCYDYIIIDEAHTVGAQESRKPVNGKIVESHLLSKILKNLPSKYRFGLTGTLPNNLLSSWNIIGKIGPILSVLSNSDVREKGTATDIHIKAIYFIHQEFPDAPMIEVDGEWVEDPFPTAKYEKEKQFLYKNQARNEVIYKICDDSSINTMILVDSLEQGQILFDNISAKKECYFVTGEMPTSERQAIIDAMEDRVGIVCVAMSKCFSTGINIKNLHRLVLPFVGKSVVKIMQSIGRTMRKHSSKKKSYIFDISDNTEYSKKHFLERLELYDKEKIKYTIKKIKL